MKDEDINNLKEMLVDFNEYSTDYTKTRCKELEETVGNTLKEIERQKEIIRQLDIKNLELTTIIKEVREYINKNGIIDLNGYDLLEILDKEK